MNNIYNIQINKMKKQEIIFGQPGIRADYQDIIYVNG